MAFSYGASPVNSSKALGFSMKKITHWYSPHSDFALHGSNVMWTMGRNGQQHMDAFAQGTISISRFGCLRIPNPSGVLHKQKTQKTSDHNLQSIYESILGTLNSMKFLEPPDSLVKQCVEPISLRCRVESPTAPENWGLQPKFVSELGSSQP